MDNYQKFAEAINQKKVLQVKFNSKEKGIIERFCIPFDFGPSRRNLKPNPNRYHFYDLDSPQGEHTLSIVPDKILSMNITDMRFNPSVYINWPTNWFAKRDWGGNS